jgi:uroporphyrinogen decarboxylase
VYAETNKIIDTRGGRGGFIVSPSHQVQGDTPPENVVAIYEAVKDYRY